MTKKKIRPSLYGVPRGEVVLPTWYEDPGYEDWVSKREQLASLYYRNKENNRQDIKKDNINSADNKINQNSNKLRRNSVKRKGTENKKVCQDAGTNQILKKSQVSKSDI